MTERGTDAREHIRRRLVEAGREHFSKGVSAQGDAVLLELLREFDPDDIVAVVGQLQGSSWNLPENWQ
ncbi:hypothetical protein [Streptomyces sp. NPDC059009]|uniref:hypothetical protein n=1 Tax=Streptomyces sp. NPDC059009 TaxID=3346694 RepID=UPI0036BE10DE